MATKPTEGTHFKNVISGDTTAKEANYTLVKDTDCGVQFTSFTDAVIFTLPTIAGGDGQVFKIMNTADDGQNTLTISPNSSDGINFKASVTDDKDLINTKATSKKGDYVVITNDASNDYWSVSDIRGIWAKE